MALYQKYAEKPRGFLALTGYTREEFDHLLPYFTQHFYERMRTHCLDGKPRGKRKYSNYQNCPLPTIEDKLFFILMYLKTNNLQEVQGALFGISQPKANQWIHCLLPILRQTLAVMDQLPAREMSNLKMEPSDDSDWYHHDGTERPIQRPRDPEEQKKYYSGKKKQHTIKNNVLIDMNCKILFLTETVEGKKHDKKLADESDYQLPPGSLLGQDSGFQGFTVEEVVILQPKKKPRGVDLSDIDKHINSWLASLRIRVEHAIGGVKRYRIVKDRIRNWKPGFKDMVFEVCCGLHNFRLDFRPWHYEPIQLHLFVSF